MYTVEEVKALAKLRTPESFDTLAEILLRLKITKR